jgi:predicted amidohydrolase YtcJ
LSLLLRGARLWPDLRPGSVFVDEGRIAALEDRPADETIDLGGALLLPGFVDTHTHLGWAGEELWRVRWSVSRTDVPGPRTRADALAAVRATRARLEPGFWLTGGGWKRDELRDDELPTLEAEAVA